MLQKPLLGRFCFVVCRGGSRIFLRRGWTTKKWWRNQILKANMWTTENTWQMIQQILYNCEADCTVLMQCCKSNVSFRHHLRGGVHPLRPPPRSAPGGGTVQCYLRVFGDCTCLQHQDTTDSSLHCPNQLHIFPIHNIDTSLLWTILLVLRIPNIMQSLPL